RVLREGVRQLHALLRVARLGRGRRDDRENQQEAHQGSEPAPRAASLHPFPPWISRQGATPAVTVPIGGPAVRPGHPTAIAPDAPPGRATSTTVRWLRPALPRRRSGDRSARGLARRGR